MTIMTDQFSAFGGFSGRPDITLAEINEIKAVDEPVENLKQFQPDTYFYRQGTGPDSWFSTSYIRTKEMFGAGDAKNMVIDNESGKV